MLILDESGSMSSNDPSYLRVQGAKMYVDMADVGDSIGVVAFKTMCDLSHRSSPSTTPRTRLCSRA